VSGEELEAVSDVNRYLWGIEEGGHVRKILFGDSWNGLVERVRGFEVREEMMVPRRYRIGRPPRQYRA
jgi:hypothetical protein